MCVTDDLEPWQARNQIDVLDTEEWNAIHSVAHGGGEYKELGRFSDRGSRKIRTAHA